MRDWEKVREQDARDARAMALANSSYLHYSTNTKPCQDPLTCRLCTESARLAVQHYRPIIETRVVESLMSAYNVRCKLTHVGGD